MNKSGVNTDFVTQYYSWLKDRTFLSKMEGGITRISFPFMNHNNDYTEIYIKDIGNDSFLLTDDGETLSELALSGLNITQLRRDQIATIIMSFGVRFSPDDAIYIESSLHDLSVKKHMLLQCISQVQDMMLLREPGARSFFVEDVADFLNTNDIRYVANQTLFGKKSKLPIRFDFTIPRSKLAPQRFIKASNYFDVDAAKALIFSWDDTRGSRAAEDELYAFINDSERTVSEMATSSLPEYGIVPVFWTKRNEHITHLAS